MQMFTKCGPYSSWSGCVYLIPSGAAVLQHRYWSTMGQIMDGCLTAPSHYLSQCWFDITDIHPRAISHKHYNDVIMGATASQITSLTIVCSTVYLGADQTKVQSSASLAFVRGIHRWPVNSPHKWPVTWKMLSFDDVIMRYAGKNCRW